MNEKDFIAKKLEQREKITYFIAQDAEKVPAEKSLQVAETFISTIREMMSK